MKAVLVYGDSNTWGSDPADPNIRFPREARWPGVLQTELGDGFHIIEEGLGGRTTVFDDPWEPGRNGLDLFAPCLETHAPLDLVVIMLGTNDVGYRWVSAAAVADGAGVLVDVAQRSVCGTGGGGPKVLLLCPPPVGPITEWADLYAAAEEKSRQLPAEFARVAKLMGCAWMDLGKVVATSPLDGWHLEASEHHKLGVAVAAKVEEMLAGD